MMANMVALEMSRVVEEWYVRDDAVHICLRLPATCNCGEQHYWFVNRDGTTRCVNCDEAHLKLKAAARAEKAGAAA